MQSRRSFLFGSLSYTCGTLLLIDQLALIPAFAKKTPRSQPSLVGPHTLSREDWAPAIVPDHVGIADKGYLCFTDEFGRLAVVDMRKPVSVKTPVKVVAELNGLGNKVVDFAVTPFAAYGLTYREGDQSEPVVDLVSVSLTPIEAPSILSDIRLGRYTEAGSIVASGDLICVSGLSAAGENLVSIYSAPKSRSSKEPVYIASLSVQLPVRALDLTEKQLTILSSANGGAKSQVDIVNLVSPDSPEIQKSLILDGDYRVLTRFKELILVAGLESGSGSKTSKFAQAKIIVASGTPHLGSSLSLEPLTAIESAAAQKDRFLVVGRNKSERLVISLTVDKSRNLTREQAINIPSAKTDGGKNTSVVMRDLSAYVATGWSGVQLLTRGKEGWAITSSYSIPKLAAAGVAVWKDLVVLAGAELQLYHVGRPERPIMMNSAAPQQAIKAMVGAGSFIVCLSKDEISLRKMEKLQTVITTTKLTANQLCFDASLSKAFAIKFLEKTTRIQPVKLFSDKLELLKSFEVPGIFNRCQASKGQLMLGGLNDIVIYGQAKASADGSAIDSNSPLEQVSSRHFENLAIRDIAFGDEVVVVTAIDQNSKGFFLVLQRSDKDLHVLGSIDLPHDGLAINCQGTRAVAVGRGLDGKDVATIINFEKSSAPQIIANLPAIEGVSSVAIRDQLAVLGGRGLEILSLS
ncbi:MAG: hypothetical protein WCT03_07575 [Candidatus Obscuribacterales bacterium]|jgi:hypothetical protein